MKTSVIALAVALLAAALLAPQASAAPTDDTQSVPPPQSVRRRTPRSPRTPSPLWGGDSAALVRIRPPCRSFELGNIHASTHHPGSMNVTLKLKCNFRLQILHIWAQLWEKRFWGWDRIGVRGSQTVYDANRATVHANDECRNNRIRATSGGWAIHNLVYYSSSGPTKYADNPCSL